MDGSSLASASLDSDEEGGSVWAGPLAGSGLLFAPQAASSDLFGSSPQGTAYSWFTNEPRKLWQLDLGDPDSRFAAAIKLPGVIIVIREEPVGGATVTHEEIVG